MGHKKAKPTKPLYQPEPGTNYWNLRLDDVVMLLDKYGGVIRSAKITRVLDFGYAIDGQVYGFDGRSMTNDSFYRPASEEERLTHNIRSAPAPLWLELGIGTLRKIFGLLDAAEKKLYGDEE